VIRRNVCIGQSFAERLSSEELGCQTYIRRFNVPNLILQKGIQGFEVTSEIPAKAVETENRFLLASSSAFEKRGDCPHEPFYRNVGMVSA
jgi:hypothetical protein